MGRYTEKNCYPPVEFVKKAPYFQLNLDKSCFMASDGTVNVLAGVNRKKHNLNLADCQELVTTLHTGAAAGVNGPVIFLTKGREVHCSFRGNRLHTVFGLPEGSCVIANGMGYMDNETWLKVEKILAQAIRKMKANG